MSCHHRCDARQAGAPWALPATVKEIDLLTATYEDVEGVDGCFQFEIGSERTELNLFVGW